MLQGLIKNKYANFTLPQPNAKTTTEMSDCQEGYDK